MPMHEAEKTKIKFRFPWTLLEILYLFIEALSSPSICGMNLGLAMGGLVPAHHTNWVI